MTKVKAFAFAIAVVFVLAIGWYFTDRSGFVRIYRGSGPIGHLATCHGEGKEWPARKLDDGGFVCFNIDMPKDASESDDSR